MHSINSAKWLLAFGQVFAWAGLYYSFPALLLEYESHFLWQRDDITLALTLSLCVSALFSPFAGWLIDRGWGRHMLLGSAVLGGVAILLQTSVNTIEAFYLTWALVGVAMAGCLYEPCFALVVRATGNEAVRVITFITLVAGFASSIAFPLAGYLADRFGFYTAIKVFATMSLGVAAPLLYFGARALPKRESASSHTPDDLQPGFISSKSFWWLTLSFSICAFVLGNILNHLLPILGERDLSDGLPLLLMTLFGPLQVVGRVAWMTLGKKISIRIGSYGCLSVMLMSLLILKFSGNNLYLLLLYMLLQSATSGIFYIIKPALTREMFGETVFGRLNGVMAFPYLLAFAVAPFVGAWVWQKVGYASLLSLLIVAMMAAIASLIASERSR